MKILRDWLISGKLWETCVQLLQQFFKLFSDLFTSTDNFTVFSSRVVNLLSLQIYHSYNFLQDKYKLD
jgi:hypothetical protein